MKFKINGEIQEIAEKTLSVKKALELAGFSLEFAAVAINSEHLPRGLYETTEIREADEIEILVPHQGG